VSWPRQIPLSPGMARSDRSLITPICYRTGKEDGGDWGRSHRRQPKELKLVSVP